MSNKEAHNIELAPASLMLLKNMCRECSAEAPYIISRKLPLR